MFAEFLVALCTARSTIFQRLPTRLNSKGERFGCWFCLSGCNYLQHIYHWHIYVYCHCDDISDNVQNIESFSNTAYAFVYIYILYIYIHMSFYFFICTDMHIHHHPSKLCPNI